MDKRKVADFIEERMLANGLTYEDTIARLINAIYAELFEEEAQ